MTRTIVNTFIDKILADEKTIIYLVKGKNGSISGDIEVYIAKRTKMNLLSKIRREKHSHNWDWVRVEFSKPCDGVKRMFLMKY